MLDVDCLMTKLAKRRPIFHSEADFQHALAWEIHSEDPQRQVRLEFNAFPVDDKPMVLDIWLPDEKIAVELKYPKRELSTVWRGEPYILKNSGAQDIQRYDFLKDIQRLETVVAKNVARTGHVILLSNEPLYWGPPYHGWQSRIDAEFRIHEGQTMSGERGWSSQAGKGTTKSRQDPIRLTGAYTMRYRRYSELPDGKYRGFRYLSVTVTTTPNAAA